MDKEVREIDQGVAGQLKQPPKTIAKYYGWNFCGDVWYDQKEEIFICEVYRYHTLIDRIKGSPEEIMKEVSAKYGWD